jgi:hypothetical protein
MLNKKIKSILVAGLVIMSMTGAVFAEGETVLGDPVVSTITNPKFTNNKAVIELQNGDIVIEITESEGFYYYTTTTWNATKLQVIDVITTFEYKDDPNTSSNEGGLGSTYHEALFNEDKCGVVLDKETHKYVNMVDDNDAKLVKIEVKFAAIKSDEGTEPGPGTEQEPEQEIDDKTPTGDASIMPIVVTAAVSAAGLFVLNRKDDEE